MFILNLRENGGGVLRSNADPDPLAHLRDVSSIFSFEQLFLSLKNPPSSENYRKTPFPRTQQRNQVEICTYYRSITGCYNDDALNHSATLFQQ